MTNPKPAPTGPPNKFSSWPGKVLAFPWFKLGRLVGGGLIALALAVFLLDLPDKVSNLYLSMNTVRLAGLFSLSRRFWTAYVLFEQYTTFIIAISTGLLIYIKRVLPRASQDWVGLVISVSLVLLILIPLGAPNFVHLPLTWLEKLRITAYNLLISLLGLFLINILFIFPDGVLVPIWTRRIVWIANLSFIASIPLFVLSNVGWTSWALVIPILLLLILALLLGFFSQVYRYLRVSTADQRRQTKWVMLSLGLIPLFFLFSIFNGSRIPSSRLLEFISMTLQFLIASLIPMMIGVSILRYKLLDIDLIIRRTLVYGGLTAVLLLIYFSGVVGLQALFVFASGQRSGLALIISTLVIAGLFNPLRRRMQDSIDRRFYRRRYDAQKTVEHFATTVRDEVELEKITADLLAVVRETMEPDQVSLWMRK